ncbi:MAG: pseudouridine synthase [Bacteroidetes bacterium]|nr:pseudouridine synthase [Bacteroidota bacterium]
MKIDKYIGQSGFISRRKANELIDEKKVTVNGKIATISTTVKEGDVILIDGKEMEVKDYVPTYIVYNKPKGIECTSEKIANNIVDAIKHPQNIYPVGRLDKESEGLILLTNHSEIIDKIANAEHGHEKEYIVTLNFPVRKQFLKDISEGVLLPGEKVKTKPCVVSLEPNAKRIFRITLTQGLNRQIRRMCTMFDYQVIKLQRVRVMNINLGKLKLGDWRDLTKEELDELFAAIN